MAPRCVYDVVACRRDTGTYMCLWRGGLPSRHWHLHVFMTWWPTVQTLAPTCVYDVVTCRRDTGTYMCLWRGGLPSRHWHLHVFMTWRPAVETLAPTNIWVQEDTVSVIRQRYDTQMCPSYWGLMSRSLHVQTAVLRGTNFLSLGCTVPPCCLFVRQQNGR